MVESGAHLRGDYRTPMEREGDERLERLIAVAVAVADERMQKYLDALNHALLPDVYPDIYNVAPLQTFTAPISFPGIFRVGRMELFAPGAAYPDRVDVFIERLGHLPFSLSATKNRCGPYKFNIMNGTQLTIVNTDTVDAANVYIEWELVRYG